MSGYSPHIRITPPAGAVIDFDLDSIEHLSVQKYFPEPVFSTKETIRRRLRNIPYGWRLTAIFEWETRPSTVSEVDQVNKKGLTDLAYWLNRSDVTLAVNFNAGGLPYRDCVLTNWSRQYADDKHILAIYHLELTLVDLLTEELVPPEFVTSPPGLMGWHG